MTYRDHISRILELSESEGVFTTAQAARFGVPREALAYTCRAGRLERLAQGAYRLIGSCPSYLDELAAIWKLTAPSLMAHERMSADAWDGIAIGGTSAASIQGMGAFHLSPYRIFAPRRINSRNPSVRFGRRDLSRSDVSFDVGIPVTRPERTLLDLVLDGEDPSLVALALADAQALTSFSPQRLEAVFTEECGARRGGELLQRLRSWHF